MRIQRWFVVACALAGATPNFALADEYTHGAICNPRAVDAAKVDYNSYGVFNNNTASSATVMCNAGYTKLTGTVSITAYDRHNGQNVCCTVKIESANGAPKWTSPEKCTGGFGSTDTVLNFPTDESGIVFFQCTLPPKTDNGVSVVSSVRFPK